MHRTFRDAAKEYLQNLEDTLQEGAKGFKDLVNKRRHVDAHLVPYFKDQRADKITSFAVKHYARQRADAGAKVATVNRELSTLSHFMNRMNEWKWIGAEDKSKIEKAEEPRKQIVVLSSENQRALMQGGIGNQDPATWLFIAFGLNTAMRHSEILRVRWDQVDFSNGRIHIPEAKAGQ